MIAQDTIEAIKGGIDLKAYLEEVTGTRFRKHGQNWLCRCPFPDHEDRHPSFSVTPADNLWHCFGCGRGGDILRFVEQYEGLAFPAAVKKLEARLNGSRKKPEAPTGTQKRSKQADAIPAGLSVKDRKLLARVVSYYQHTLGEDAAGLAYMQQERGIRELQSLKDFGAGFVNGSLSTILPEDDEVLTSLKRIGLLDRHGHEIFINCVVFPLFAHNGDIVNLYGRCIKPDSELRHRYLPGPRCGLVNPQAVKHSQSLLLTESIIDALTLYDQGFRHVMPLYGVNGLTEDHLSCVQGTITDLYLVFDADEAGRRAAERLAAQFQEQGLRSYMVSLPAKDVNRYFQRCTPEEFEALLKQANPHSLEQSETVRVRRQSLYKTTEHGFVVGYGPRQYHVKGIQRGETSLKVTLKASTAVEGQAPFELSTVDLYSARSRSYFAKLCATLFKASEALVKDDLGKLLEVAENYRPEEPADVLPQASAAETEAALGFLKNPELFQEILDDFDTLGVIGERTNKLVGYLAAVSRKLEEPLSVLIQSRSAAGKSTLQDALLSLVPPEDAVKYTRLTDQALFYKAEDSLVHKLLAIEEAEGMGGAAYSLRNIQSAGQITVAATGKDPLSGKMRTEEYTVKGPVAVMITTTAAELDGETASRFLFLTIDESSEMTAAIHRHQRERETLEGLRRKRAAQIRAKHHTAQRLLTPLAVVNPFSRYLSYPTHSLRTRRDHQKYLGLIRATAFVSQYQKAIRQVDVAGERVDYVEVSLDDIARANRLADEVLGQSLDELAPPSRTLLEGIVEMVTALAQQGKTPLHETFFSRRLIREYLDWSDWQIRAHIKQLEALEYLRVRVGSQGKEYAYALNYAGQGAEHRRFYLNLTPVEEIETRMWQAEQRDQSPVASRQSPVASDQSPVASDR